MPNLQDYLDAANMVYNQDTSIAPPGWNVVAESSPSLKSDGFYAQAYSDGNGNIIISFEGTDPSRTSSYSWGTFLADGMIFAHVDPPTFDEAYNFASQIKYQYLSSNVYVTGHSLGGAEAEYVALKMGPSLISGGVTFGAPGLPGYNGPSNLGNLTDYVDFGDPIGNFISNGNHYGTVQFVGFSGNASQLPWNSNLTFSTASTILTQDINAFHLLPTYALDLGYTVAQPFNPIAADWSPLASAIAAQVAGTPPAAPSSGTYPVVNGVQRRSGASGLWVPVSAVQLRKILQTAPTTSLTTQLLSSVVLAIW